MPADVREAGVEDAGAIARVQIAAWRGAYGGIVPDAFLARMDERERAERWRARITDRPGRQITYIADLEGAAAGFAAVGECRDPDSTPATGELYAIYVLPEWWRQGVGRALHVASMDGLRRGGYQHARLWVLRANSQAQSFYAGLGWSADGVHDVHPFGDSELPIIRYARRV